MARPRSDIAPRIVEAARARFLREGVDGASLRAIAGDARTSVGMIHYYFPTKDELFLAVVEDIYGVVLADLTRALASDVPVHERWQRLYQRLGAMSEREAMTMRLVVREALVSSARLRRLVERFRRGHIPLLLAAVGDGVRDGVLRADLPPLLVALVSFLIGAVPPFALRQVGAWLPGAPSPTGPALAELLVGILLHGVGTTAPTAPVRAKRANKRARP